MKKILFLCIFLASFSSILVAASQSIGTYPIPLMVENENEGVFVDLVKEITNRSGIEIKIVVAPPPRTISEFQKGITIGFFPALDVLLSGKVAKSENIYVKKDFVFVKKGTTGLTNIKSLEGKTVGVTKGYPYVAELMNDKKITLEFAENDILNMKKLSKGRIDAFVVEEKSGLKALEQSGEKDITYDSKMPLSNQDVYFAFQNTPEGAKLAEGFSKALSSMKKDGTFGKIMSKASK